MVHLRGASSGFCCIMREPGFKGTKPLSLDFSSSHESHRKCLVFFFPFHILGYFFIVSYKSHKKLAKVQMYIAQ